MIDGAVNEALDRHTAKHGRNYLTCISDGGEMVPIKVNGLDEMINFEIEKI